MYSEDQLQAPKRSYSEDQLQAQIVQLTRNNYDCLIFSIPNGGFRNSLEASKLKATGLLAGIPDLQLIYNPMAISLPSGYGGEPSTIANSNVVFIELKTPTGKLSEQQILIHSKLAKLNIPVYIIRTIQEFQDLLNRLQVPLKTHKLQQT